MIYSSEFGELSISDTLRGDVELTEIHVCDGERKGGPVNDPSGTP